MMLLIGSDDNANKLMEFARYGSRLRSVGGTSGGGNRKGWGVGAGLGGGRGRDPRAL